MKPLTVTIHLARLIPVHLSCYVSSHPYCCCCCYLVLSLSGLSCTVVYILVFMHPEMANVPLCSYIFSYFYFQFLIHEVVLCLFSFLCMEYIHFFFMSTFQKIPCICIITERVWHYHVWRQSQTDSLTWEPRPVFPSLFCFENKLNLHKCFSYMLWNSSTFQALFAAIAPRKKKKTISTKCNLNRYQHLTFLVSSFDWSIKHMFYYCKQLPQTGCVTSVSLQTDVLLPNKIMPISEILFCFKEQTILSHVKPLITFYGTLQGSGSQPAQQK